MNLSSVECLDRSNYSIVMRSDGENCYIRGVTLDVRLFYSNYDFFSTKGGEHSVSEMGTVLQYLNTMFDQTTLLSCHDPLLDLFAELEEQGGCDLRIFSVDGEQLTIEQIGKIVMKEVVEILKPQSNVTVQRLELIQRAQITVIYPYDITS